MSVPQFMRGGIVVVAVVLAAACLLFAGQAAVLAQDITPVATEAPQDSEVAPPLPPVDLPTMNEQGYTFELTSTFTAPLETTPTEAPVFLVSSPTFAPDQARQIADQLAIRAEVAERGDGVFVAEGNGNLYLAPGLIQYVSPAPPRDGPLPSDEEAIAYAKEWLRQTELLPADLGAGEVRSRLDDPGRVIVVFKPVAPAALLSDLPGISVTLGPAGTILDASIRWASLTQGDVYALRPADQAWDDVAKLRAYLQTELPEDAFPQGSNIIGTAEYSAVSIAYSSSGVPGEAQFLQPVFVYTGKLTPEGAAESFPITAYVPALVNILQPVG